MSGNARRRRHNNPQKGTVCVPLRVVVVWGEKRMLFHHFRHGGAAAVGRAGVVGAAGGHQCQHHNSHQG